LFAKPEPGTHIYCCGPQRLTEDVRAAAAHWQEAQVHFEVFQATLDENFKPEPFDIEIASTGKVIRVPAEQSALDALRGEGFILPSSCELGVCGACECGYRDGVVIHRDAVLGVAARQDRLMLCVSRARVRGRSIFEEQAMTDKPKFHNTAELGIPKVPLSHAAEIGGLIFLAGQVGVVAETGKLAGDDVAAQTRQAFENIGAVLKSRGKSFADIAKATNYLTDMANFSAMNEVYKEFLSEPYPARTAIAVAALPLGAIVEIDVIAAV
jgi:reactive intermediate/imine deaminase